MTRTTLLALAERVEAARVSDRTGLRNEVALATGWHRVEPRFTKSKHGAWIKPCDFIGVHSDGSPKLDSLHGTDMHREPPNFLESLDAAMSLVPSGWHSRECLWQSREPHWSVHIHHDTGGAENVASGYATTEALATVAASLRAIAGSLPD